MSFKTIAIFIGILFVMVLLLVLFYAGLAFFTYVDETGVYHQVFSPNNSSLENLDNITIIGSTKCIRTTNDALGLLKEESLNDYKNVHTYVGHIDCTGTVTVAGLHHAAMYPYSDPPLMKISDTAVDLPLKQYAALIVHEACHSKQYHDYVEENPVGEVPTSVIGGNDAEALCYAAQWETLDMLNGDQDALDFVEDQIKTRSNDIYNAWKNR